MRGAGKHQHGAVVVLGTHHAGGGEHTRLTRPYLPASREVERVARFAGAQRTKLVRAADDPLERIHDRRAKPLTLALRVDSHRLDVPAAQRASTVKQAPLYDRPMREQLPI